MIPSRTVSLTDQFRSTTARVLKPFRFCNPADKNNEGICEDPTAHLMCYKISAPPMPRIDVIVTNQFGEQALTVIKPETLCNPATKNMVPSDLDIDHFQCYRVRGRGFTSRTVVVADQFETQPATVLKPYSLCNPVSKNGGDIRFPESHLTCYTVKQARMLPLDVTVQDQFFEQDSHPFVNTCRKAATLCVPSAKRIASPAGAFLDEDPGVFE